MSLSTVAPAKRQIASVPGFTLDLGPFGYVDAAGQPLHLIVRHGLTNAQQRQFEQIARQFRAHARTLKAYEAQVTELEAAGKWSEFPDEPEMPDDLRHSTDQMMTWLVVDADFDRDASGNDLGSPSELRFWDGITDDVKAAVFAAYQHHRERRIAAVGGDTSDFLKR